MNTIILATSEFCGPCANVKSYIKEYGLNVEIKSLEKDFPFFEENNIRTVPTLLVGKVRYSGAERIMRFFEEMSSSS